MRKKADTAIIQPTLSKKEETWEISLRPKTIREYIGQTDIKDNLQIFIQAAKKRNEALDHLLLFGPPGLGKTTLANVIAHELDVDFLVSSGTALQKPSDIISVLNAAKPYSVLFIDEIHRLKLPLEEILYSAMEDFRLDIMVGKGQSSEAVSIPLAPFTLIGATTRNGDLSAPLRHRFGETFRLQFYTTSELIQIIERTARILGVLLQNDVAEVIAARSRGTPRIANRLLKRIRDFAEIAEVKNLDRHFVSDCLHRLGIKENGLDNNDTMLLTVMVQKFQGRAVGIKTLASACNETEETILNVYEPYLLQEGFLERTTQGRRPTEKAFAHLGLAKPQFANEAAGVHQEKLFDKSE